LDSLWVAGIGVGLSLAAYYTGMSVWRKGGWGLCAEKKGPLGERPRGAHRI